MKIGPSVFFYGTNFASGREFFHVDETLSQTLRLTTEQDQTTNTQLLWYGEDFLTGYSKFSPNQRRYDTDINGEKYAVTINSRGFRGKEFDAQKQPGTVRVIALGASSTFGYHDRDNETYPYYMEELLNQRLSNQPCNKTQRFEVLNFGLPHQTSAQIYLLFMSEAIELAPDIVTFYEGVNDSALFKRPETNFFLRSLRSIFMIFALIDNLLNNSPFVIPPAPFTRFSEQDFQKHLEGRSEFFIHCVSQIYEECKKRNLLFIVANQQAQSYFIKAGELKGTTYEEEGERIRKKMADGGQLTVNELYFLTHNVIMDELKDWALTNNIPFVNIIEALNQDRDQLTSWVHLTPQGNRIIASQFTDAIFKHFCN